MCFVAVPVCFLVSAVGEAGVYVVGCGFRSSPLRMTESFVVSKEPELTKLGLYSSLFGGGAQSVFPNRSRLL